MTTTYTDTCDGCGATRTWSHRDKKADLVPWWSFQYNSTDFPEQRAALIAAIGAPKDDEWVER